MTLLATAILQLIKIIYFFYNRQLYGFSRISEPHFCYSAAFASKPSERDNYKDTYLLFLSTKFAGWFGEQCPKPLKQILNTSMTLLIRHKWDLIKLIESYDYLSEFFFLCLPYHHFICVTHLQFSGGM